MTSSILCSVEKWLASWLLLAATSVIRTVAGCMNCDDSKVNMFIFMPETLFESVLMLRGNTHQHRNRFLHNTGAIYI